MSYSILYRSMFVKLSDGRYIPMMEMGDNNVYEPSYGRGKARRARSWSNINLNNGQKFFTKDEISACLDKWNADVELERERDRNSDDEWRRESAEKANFGYYDAISVYGKGSTWGTTFNDVRNIIMGGIKNCISFDDAVKKCRLHITYWEKNDGDNYFPSQKSANFDTEEEMFAFINEKFGDRLGWYFVYGSFDANQHYNFKKAVSGFARHNGKKCRKFKLVTMVKDCDTKKYVTIKDGGFMLVDDIRDAVWFDKYVSNGLYISDVVYKLFPNIDGGLRALYEYEITKIGA